MDNLIQNQDEILLSLQQLSVSHKDNILLGPLNIAFKRGDHVALIGVSGSGKSLFAKSLVALNTHQGLREKYGSVLWNGRVVAQDSSGLESQLDRLRGSAVFYLYQDSLLSLSPSKKIKNIFRDFMKRHGLQYSADDLIDLFDTLKIEDPKEMMDRYPFQVSGGQLQRIMIGMSLLSSADLIVADEPTSALDAPLKKDVLDLLTDQMRRANKTLLLISHNVELLKKYVDRCVLLKSGKIVYDCATKQLAESGIEYVDLLLHRSKVLNQLSTSPRDLATQGCLLEVKNLRVQYDKKSLFNRTQSRPAVQSVDFDLYRGEVLGIVGRSGSGKSTIAKAISGLVSFQADQLRIAGSEISPRDIHKDIKLIFQNPMASLNPELTIRVQLEEALVQGGCNAADLIEDLDRLLERVSLESKVLDALPAQISGGQGQRAAIARALATKPAVLICDECLSSLDVVLKQEIIDLFKELIEEDGLSMLFISHDLGAIAQLCDRIAYLEGGRLLELTDSKRFFEQPESDSLVSFIRAYQK